MKFSLLLEGEVLLEFLQILRSFGCSLTIENYKEVIEEELSITPNGHFLLRNTGYCAKIYYKNFSIDVELFERSSYNFDENEYKKRQLIFFLERNGFEKEKAMILEKFPLKQGWIGPNRSSITAAINVLSHNLGCKPEDLDPEMVVKEAGIKTMTNDEVRLAVVNRLRKIADSNLEKANAPIRSLSKLNLNHIRRIVNRMSLDLQCLPDELDIEAVIAKLEINGFRDDELRQAVIEQINK